jgi:hypothetical protein
VKRTEATRRIERLLELVAGGDGRYVPRVREVWIFGSYARGAVEVGDVDLAIEFDQTKDEAGRWFATALAGGFDQLAALRRELRGNQRVLELHLNDLDELRKEGFDPQLLWERGDSFEAARGRLHALAPDADAGRASRDTVHPLLAEVEKLVPRPARQEFSLFMWAGWFDTKLVDLPAREAKNPVTRRRFRQQWSVSNPRFRAAHAVASYLEEEGIAPLIAGGTLYSDQREVIDEERDYWSPAVAVHFGLHARVRRVAVPARRTLTDPFGGKDGLSRQRRRSNLSPKPVPSGSTRPAPLLQVAHLPRISPSATRS